MVEEDQFEGTKFYGKYFSGTLTQTPILIEQWTLCMIGSMDWKKFKLYFRLEYNMKNLEFKISSRHQF